MFTHFKSISGSSGQIRKKISQMKSWLWISTLLGNGYNVETLPGLKDMGDIVETQKDRSKNRNCNLTDFINNSIFNNYLHSLWLFCNQIFSEPFTLNEVMSYFCTIHQKCLPNYNFTSITREITHIVKLICWKNKNEKIKQTFTGNPPKFNKF